VDLELTWLTKEARDFISLDGGYLRDQTAEERYEQICKTIGKIANKHTPEKLSEVKDIAKRFRRYVSNGWVSFASPVLANFGHKYNFPISCNYSRIADSLDSILSGLKEIGMLSKHGAGVAVNFSDIRPSGSKISAGGVSEGIMPFISLYEELIKKVSQNGVRRGFMTAYLSVDHPEIMSFLEIGTDGHPIKLITNAVTIPKGWMQRLKEGDKDCRKIWAKILKNRAEIGYPYILFEENCNNENSPKVYRDKGFWINSSNLCVAGNQKVVTSKGIFTAEQLYLSGESLQVFDGSKQVSSSPMRLIEKNADVYRITLSNGMTHDVTSYHKVKARLGDSRRGNKFQMVECKDLTKDHQVAFQTNEGLFGSAHLPDEAFVLGLWQGDGTISGNNIKISIWENDFDIIPEVQERLENIWNSQKYDLVKKVGRGERTVPAIKPQFIEDKHTGDSKVRRKNLYSTAFNSFNLEFDKNKVSDLIYQSDKETQWSYIKGLYIADGTVGTYGKNSVGDPIALSLTSISKSFLQDLQILFANLGINSKIYRAFKEGKRYLPDNKGGQKLYTCKDSWRLVICNRNDLQVFEENTGFLSRKGVSIENRKYRDITKKAYPVESVEYIGKQDVYCLTVDTDEHVWTCNGIITSNCSEVLGYCDSETTFACCLSSLVLPYYDDWKDDPNFIFDMNIMLDCVLEEYIEKATGVSGLEKAVKFAKEHRTIGLGVLGFHSLLQRKRIAIGSMDSFYLNEEIFKKIREESDRASKWMAQNWGEPEYMKGTGLRNGSRIAIAPTKSTSEIAGGYSLGIEPIKSNYHVKKLAKSMKTYKNPELVELLKSYKKNTKETWESILLNNGSVQHLDFLTENEKNVFKTFSEVSQADLISLAAQRQKYIDQGQSLNLMFHPVTPPKDINKLIIEAYDKGIKTLYYQYSISAAQEFNRELLQCSACEG